MSQACLLVRGVSHSLAAGDASWDEPLLREAQQHLTRAVVLAPDDLVAKSWLEKVPSDPLQPLNVLIKYLSVAIVD